MQTFSACPFAIVVFRKLHDVVAVNEHHFHHVENPSIRRPCASFHPSFSRSTHRQSRFPFQSFINISPRTATSLHANTSSPPNHPWHNHKPPHGIDGEPPPDSSPQFRCASITPRQIFNLVGPSPRTTHLAEPPLSLQYAQF